LQEALRFLQDYRLVIYPLILFFVMLFRPQGLLGMKEFSFVKTFDFIGKKLSRNHQVQATGGGEK
jgi:branched-chain amino acid transport system permease protein